jgi:dihydroxyacetone kinase-like protein
MEFNLVNARKWMIKVNGKIQENKEFLTNLDQSIGDGDHGLNMARGFQEAVNKIDQIEYEDLGSFFKDVGMTLISKVGGAAGPLYGTAFMNVSSFLKDKDKASATELAGALLAGLEGIKSRGRAQVGDKTMVDVWNPVVNFLTEQGDNLNPEQLASLAHEKMEATKELEAKKGRASYLGKRSVGHVDPGAASSYYLFLSLANALKGDSDYE